jgi:hypothetical protein
MYSAHIWMRCAYAIARGAGTQATPQGVGAMIGGPPGEVRVALLMGAGWAISRRPAKPHAIRHGLSSATGSA